MTTYATRPADLGAPAKKELTKGQLFVKITKGSSTTVELNTWKLHATNVGSINQLIHAWIQSSETQKTTCYFKQEIVDRQVTLTIPGTGKNVITPSFLFSETTPANTTFRSLLATVRRSR
jgi:hypothetical protein